jgi:hypothetical protein
VRDEDHRKATIAQQIRQQLQDLGLTITSSAVAGSSAISNCGSQASAMAPSRCFCPPDSS